ncbi:unnamed protein product, partial [Discosporangium mesarthrocarpum]
DIENLDDFTCPEEANRVSEPDLRNRTAEENFKAGGGFIYFQHLRKAGGTGFCDLAKRREKPE